MWEQSLKTKNIIFLDSTVGHSLHKKALKTVSLYWYLYKTAGKGKWFPFETLFYDFSKEFPPQKISCEKGFRD